MGSNLNFSARPRGKYMGKISKNTKDRAFVCEASFCNRAFKRQEHLKRHMKSHLDAHIRAVQNIFPDLII
jgi:hypothetical protein